MNAAPVAHVGILVSDVVAARNNWSKALGGTFSPVVRYRPAEWRFHSEVTTGDTDLRQTIYLGVDPSFEVQEFVHNGMHAADRGEGGHHLGFPPIDDVARHRDELSMIGVRPAAETYYRGRLIIEFTEPDDLNNVSAEFVVASPGHLNLKDDGSPVDRLPNGDGTVFDADTIIGLDEGRPRSGVVEIGVVVDDIGRALGRWSAVTGRSFTDDAAMDGTRSVTSDGPGARIRLLEAIDPTAREGISYAMIEVADLKAERSRLIAEGIPLTLDTEMDIHVEPAYLNGFSLRYRLCTEVTSAVAG